MISLTSPVETRAHRWPAGLKLGALCLATFVLFTVRSVPWHLAFLAFMLVLYALPGRAFLRTGLSRLRVLWPFVVLILVWHALVDDIVPGAIIVLRMVTAVGLANLVTMTTTLDAMMRVMQVLMAPLKWLGVDTRPVEIAMGLVIRFTPALAAQGQILAMAWRARSAKRIGWRIVPPFAALAMDDADHVAEALRARGGVGRIGS